MPYDLPTLDQYRRASASLDLRFLKAFREDCAKHDWFWLIQVDLDEMINLSIQRMMPRL